MIDGYLAEKLGFQRGISGLQSPEIDRAKVSAVLFHPQGRNYSGEIRSYR